MFGHSSNPSKIYDYGCKAPHIGAAEITNQILRMHRYRNRLVEIELRRREATDTALREMCPELADVEGRIVMAEKALEDHLGVIKKENAKARRKRATPDQIVRSKELRANLKDFRARRKELRSELFESPDWQARQEAISEQNASEQREARRQSNLFWGNYLVVEQAASAMRRGAPPRFFGWHRAKQKTQKIAVQIQKGITFEQALSGEDTRLRIVDDPERSTEKKRRVLVYFRIGSEGRTPVWGCARATLHRPLPEGSLIKWVYVTRKPIACQFKWSVQFVISHPDGFPRPDLAQDGSCGINSGWRLVDDGLRVATLAGDDGRREELLIPAKELERWKKPVELQSIRDVRFDDARASLSNWMTTIASLPSWVAEKTKSLRQWRSPGKLAGLVFHWRENRFDGDAEIFDTLEAWRQRDRHLYEWQANQLKKAIRWRRNLYRNFASRVSREYKTVVVEDANWQEVQKRPDEEENEYTANSRTYARIAAVGELREFISETANVFVKGDSDSITHRCHGCGFLNNFDAISHLAHVCDGCGLSWDQDYNAAMNLLQQSSGAMLAETP